MSEELAGMVRGDQEQRLRYHMAEKVTKIKIPK